jgi:outer membrane protein assembly factor BamB
MMNIFRRSLWIVGLAATTIFTLNSCTKYSEDVVLPKEVTATVYIGNNNNFVYALDPLTGEKKWELNAGSPVLASIVIHNNAAWVASSAGVLYKVDRATGRVLNQRDFGAPIIVTPLSYNNILYVAAGSRLHYINNGTLESIHTGDAGGIITGAPTINNILGFDYKYVFVAAQNTVRTFREDSLFTNTTFTAPDAGMFVTSPCVENDTIMYIGNTNGKVYGVNTRTSTVKWAYTTGGPITSTILTIGGNLLFGSHDANFYSIDTETGRLRWAIKTDDRIASSPFVYKQNVYFGGYDKNIYNIDIIDGVVKWKVPTVGLIKGSPVIHQDKLYIVGYDQIMVCLDTETGGQYWNKNIGGTVDGAPVLDNITSVAVPAIDGAHPMK